MCDWPWREASGLSGDTTRRTWCQRPLACTAACRLTRTKSTCIGNVRNGKGSVQICSKVSRWNRSPCSLHASRCVEFYPETKPWERLWKPASPGESTMSQHLHRGLKRMTTAKYLLILMEFPAFSRRQMAPAGASHHRCCGELAGEALLGLVIAKISPSPCEAGEGSNLRKEPKSVPLPNCSQ